MLCLQDLQPTGGIFHEVFGKPCLIDLIIFIHNASRLILRLPAAIIELCLFFKKLEGNRIQDFATRFGDSDGSAIHYAKLSRDQATGH